MRIAHFIATAALCVAASQAGAATYRCGNTFQDKPCEAGTPQQEVKPSGGGAAPLPAMSHISADASATCKRVGDRIEDVVRKRDAGATAQQQMQGADPETVRAVQTVYSMGKNGKATVAQLRALAEMGCLGDEQVKAQTQAAMRAAREADRQGLSPAQRNAAMEKAAGLQDPCRSMREALATMDHIAKAGGDAKYLAAMREQRALMERERARLNCR